MGEKPEEGQLFLRKCAYITHKGEHTLTEYYVRYLDSFVQEYFDSMSSPAQRKKRIMYRFLIEDSRVQGLLESSTVMISSESFPVYNNPAPGKDNNVDFITYTLVT